MSEAEKKRRLEYKQNRKKWLMIISGILCGLILLTTVFGIVYSVLDETLCVEYEETSSVNYTVKLFPNTFFDKEWQGAGQAYVSELTDSVKADFAYDIAVKDPKVTYCYTYHVDAQLIVEDKLSGTQIYHPTYSIVDPVTKTVTGNAQIRESMFIDYDTYRTRALDFIDSYRLSGVESYIAVNLHVSTVGDCKNATAKSYDVTMKLPLIDRTFQVETLSTVPTGAPKVLECSGGIGATVFHVLTIVFGTLSVLSAAFLVFFVFMTRNYDINYSIRIKRIVSSYKPFIQQITAPFDAEGYQVVHIKTFQEMLDVRDATGTPLLMYENEDATATSFVIPATNGVLYSFEIRVEDYDDIYRSDKSVEELDPPMVESVEETVEESAVEETQTSGKNSIPRSLCKPIVLLLAFALSQKKKHPKFAVLSLSPGKKRKSAKKGGRKKKKSKR